MRVCTCPCLWITLRWLICKRILFNWLKQKLALTNQTILNTREIKQSKFQVHMNGKYSLLGFPGGASGKGPTCQWRRCKRCRFYPWLGKIPWRRKWQPTPAFLPRESQGRRSLAGSSPRGHTESDMTKQLCMHAH